MRLEMKFEKSRLINPPIFPVFFLNCLFKELNKLIMAAVLTTICHLTQEGLVGNLVIACNSHLLHVQVMLTTKAFIWFSQGP